VRVETDWELGESRVRRRGEQQEKYITGCGESEPVTKVINCPFCNDLHTIHRSGLGLKNIHSRVRMKITMSIYRR
jgi:hypothetical protein